MPSRSGNFKPYRFIPDETAPNAFPASVSEGLERKELARALKIIDGIA
jgi:hypothetical protein